MGDVLGTGHVLAVGFRWSLNVEARREVPVAGDLSQSVEGVDVRSLEKESSAEQEVQGVYGLSSCIRLCIGPAWTTRGLSHVCMYVCMYVCVYVCMYVRT